MWYFWKSLQWIATITGLPFFLVGHYLGEVGDWAHDRALKHTDT